MDETYDPLEGGVRRRAKKLAASEGDDTAQTLGWTPSTFDAFLQGKFSGGAYLDPSPVPGISSDLKEVTRKLQHNMTGAMNMSGLQSGGLYRASMTRMWTFLQGMLQFMEAWVKDSLVSQGVTDIEETETYRLVQEGKAALPTEPETLTQSQIDRAFNAWMKVQLQVRPAPGGSSLGPTTLDIPASIQTRMAQLEKEKEDLDAQLTRAWKIKDVTEDRERQWREDLLRSNERNSELQGQLAKERALKQQAEEALEDARNRCDQLDRVLKEMEDQNAEQKDVISLHKRQQVRLERSEKNHIEEITKKDYELRELAERVGELEVSLREKESEIIEVKRTQAETECKTGDTVSRDEFVKMQKEMRGWRARYSNLKKDFESLNEIMTSRDSRPGSAGVLNVMRKRLEDRQAELDESRDREMKLKEDYVKLEEQLKSQGTTKTASEQKLQDTIETLQSDLETRSKGFEERQKVWKVQIQTLRKENDELRPLKNTNVVLTREKGSLEAELDLKKSAYSRLEQRKKELQDRFQKEQEAQTNLRKELNELELEKSKLVSASKDKDAALKVMQREKDGKEKELKTVKAQLTELQEKQQEKIRKLREAHVKQLEQLQGDNVTSCASSQAELARVQSELDTVNNTLNQLQRLKEQVETANQDLLAELQQLQKDLEENSTIIENERAINAALKNQVAEKDIEISALRNEKEETSRVIGELRAAINESKERLSKESATIEELQREIGTLRDELTTLTQKNDDLQTQLGNLQSKYKDLSSGIVSRLGVLGIQRDYPRQMILTLSDGMKRAAEAVQDVAKGANERKADLNLDYSALTPAECLDKIPELGTILLTGITDLFVSLKKEKAAHEQTRADCEVRIREIENNHLSQLQGTEAEQQKTINELQARIRENAIGWKETEAKHQESLASLQKEVSRLEEENGRLVAEVNKQKETLVRYTQEYKTEVERQGKELEKVQESLQVKEGEVKQCEGRIQELEKELEGLRLQLKASQEALTEQESAKAREISDFRSQNGALNEKISLLQAENAELKGQVAKLTAEQQHQALLLEQYKKQSKIVQDACQLQGTLSPVDIANTASAKLQQAFEEIQALKEKGGEQFEELQECLSREKKLKQKEGSTQEEYSSLQDRIQEIQEDKKRISADAQDLQVKLDGMKEKVQDCSLALEEVQKECAQELVPLEPAGRKRRKADSIKAQDNNESSVDDILVKNLLDSRFMNDSLFTVTSIIEKAVSSWFLKIFLLELTKPYERAYQHIVENVSGIENVSRTFQEVTAKSAIRHLRAVAYGYADASQRYKNLLSYVWISLHSTLQRMGAIFQEQFGLRVLTRSCYAAEGFSPVIIRHSAATMPHFDVVIKVSDSIFHVVRVPDIVLNIVFRILRTLGLSFKDNFRTKALIQPSSEVVVPLLHDVAIPPGLNLLRPETTPLPQDIMYAEVKDEELPQAISINVNGTSLLMPATNSVKNATDLMEEDKAKVVKTEEQLRNYEEGYVTRIGIKNIRSVMRQFENTTEPDFVSAWEGILQENEDLNTDGFLETIHEWKEYNILPTAGQKGYFDKLFNDITDRFYLYNSPTSRDCAERFFRMMLGLIEGEASPQRLEDVRNDFVDYFQVMQYMYYCLQVEEFRYFLMALFIYNMATAIFGDASELLEKGLEEANIGDLMVLFIHLRLLHHHDPNHYIKKLGMGISVAAQAIGLQNKAKEIYQLILRAGNGKRVKIEMVKAFPGVMFNFLSTFLFETLGLLLSVPTDEERQSKDIAVVEDDIQAIYNRIFNAERDK